MQSIRRLPSTACSPPSRSIVSRQLPLRSTATSRRNRPCRSSHSLHSTLQRPRSDSSLLGQCLRLVWYAIGVLPHVRLCAFHRRSSLPSLCYRITGNSVAAHETPAANDYGSGGVKRSRLLDLLSLTKRREESKSGCDRHHVIAWAVQLRVDFADCKRSLAHHGRQISESESEAQGTATGESQKRGSKERATGLSRQGGAEKEVDDAAKQQPWFVRRFRPAQLGRWRLAGSGEVGAVFEALVFRWLRGHAASEW